MVHTTKGGEFTGNEFHELIISYGIKSKPSTSRNPQSNGVIERVHQTVHNMLRTFDLQIQAFDPIEPWQGYLSAVAYAIRSTYHTTLHAKPAELVYGRDMIFDRAYKPNWEEIRRLKQTMINKNNIKENKKELNMNIKQATWYYTIAVLKINKSMNVNMTDPLKSLRYMLTEQ